MRARVGATKKSSPRPPESPRPAGNRTPRVQRLVVDQGGPSNKEKHAFNEQAMKAAEEAGRTAAEARARARLRVLVDIVHEQDLNLFWVYDPQGVGRIKLKDLWRCALILGVKFSDAAKRAIATAFDRQGLGVVSYEQMLIELHSARGGMAPGAAPAALDVSDAALDGMLPEAASGGFDGEGSKLPPVTKLREGLHVAPIGRLRAAMAVMAMVQPEGSPKADEAIIPRRTTSAFYASLLASTGLASQLTQRKTIFHADQAAIDKAQKDSLEEWKAVEELQRRDQGAPVEPEVGAQRIRTALAVYRASVEVRKNALARPMLFDEIKIEPIAPIASRGAGSSAASVSNFDAPFPAWMLVNTDGAQRGTNRLAIFTTALGVIDPQESRRQQYVDRFGEVAPQWQWEDGKCWDADTQTWPFLDCRWREYDEHVRPLSHTSNSRMRAHVHVHGVRAERIAISDSQLVLLVLCPYREPVCATPALCAGVQAHSPGVY